MRLRVLVDQPAEAAWNMAIDEALLQLAAMPTLRLYGWRPHAVSLGYFQAATDFADLPAGTPLVRRLTGGGAICHGDEVTFSLALDAAVLPPAIADSYALLHDAVLVALRDVGVIATRLQDGHPQTARPAERWCFTVPGQGDLVTPTGKLLGSAQRRIRAPTPRVLHHGSLVLHRPALTPFVAAIADTAPTTFSRQALLATLIDHLAAALAMTPETGERTAAESALAAQLQQERYGNPAFTFSR
ncbi:MAG: lipoate--protein ligase family protein [Planctomycetes bacterium]|nr:lipoate--protein ligase family protein [Planctomycetota bacterium]